MKMQKVLAVILSIVITLSLAACGSKKGAVYVQPVSELCAMGGIAPGDRFAGIVVSENVAEIKKDADKSVLELYVKEGDDVKTGDQLFAYDVEELQLTLDKQRLEKEQLEATIESLKQQIEQLEKQYNKASTRDKLEYSVQIQTSQVDMKEAELNLKTKEAEVAKSEETLNNSTVVSPVDGRVTSISENGTDDYGNPLPYISIQQAGAYRIKGTLGEMQQGGLMQGDRIRAISRLDENQVWYGTVTLIDYQNPVQGNPNSMYSNGKGDEMGNASRYPFYVELENMDGLLLGQHVYLEKDTGESGGTGLQLSSAFIAYDDDGSTFVWAENRGKLEKRDVTLGDYNGNMDTFAVLDGLTTDDYIAFPDPEVCKAGAPTSHTPVIAEDNGGDMGDMGGKGDFADDMGDMGGKGDVVDDMGDMGDMSDMGDMGDMGMADAEVPEASEEGGAD